MGFERLILLFSICLEFTSSGCATPTTLHEPLLPRNSHVDSRVARILKETPLIDGHNDLAYFLRWGHNNRIYFDNFTVPFENGTLRGEVDLLRLRKGQVGGTFWSVYADCPKNSTYTPEYFAKAIAEADAAVDVIQRITSKYDDAFGRPYDSSVVKRIFKSGRIVSPLGLESLHLIGNSFAKLRDYHARGVRYATLTHNCHNIYADAAQEDLSNGSTVPATPKWNGVSEMGHRVVRELNRLGILVDLSHASTDTQRNVLGAPSLNANGTVKPWNGSLSPPIFSHSSAYAICPHPRNVPDDVLHLVKARQGLVMVTFYPGFISCKWPDDTGPVPGKAPPIFEINATVSQVVRHMRYIGDLIGYEHVGIGSDFDGTGGSVPRGLEDVSKYPNLVAEMLEQGIEEADVKKILGENLLRVWRTVDEVRDAMARDGFLPEEDDLPSVPNPFG